jgi:putative flippase GtrA
MTHSRSTFVATADKYALTLLAYGTVSVASALTEWASFIAALPLVGAVLAALTGFFTATILNSILSHFFVFRSRRSFIEEFVLIFGMGALVFAGNFLLFYILYAFAAVSPLYAKILGTCFGFVFNYAIRQLFIFSRFPRFARISAFIGEKSQSPDRNNGAIARLHSNNSRDGLF